MLHVVLLLATRKVTAMVGVVTQTLPPSLVRAHPTVHATFCPLMANWCQTLSWRRVPLPPLKYEWQWCCPTFAAYAEHL